MAIIIFFIAHWYISLFFQSFFHHRYAAHRMFSMSKVWEKIFIVISYISQGSSFLSAYAYGIMHRLHHAYADTEKDVHSPKHDGNIFSMMWRTKKIYSDIFWERMQVDERYKKDLPRWAKLERFAERWPSRIFFALLYISFYAFFATHWWMYLLLPIHFMMGPVHGAVINWFAHKYGYRNYEVGDTSKNLMPLDIFMLGEGYHNNHHKFGGRPNFAVRWFEFDPVYPFIRLFDWIGIIKLRKQLAA